MPVKISEIKGGTSMINSDGLPIIGKPKVSSTNEDGLPIIKSEKKNQDNSSEDISRGAPPYVPLESETPSTSKKTTTNDPLSSWHMRDGGQKGKLLYNFKSEAEFNSKLNNGDLTASDLENLKSSDPEKYNKLAKQEFPTSGDAFLKSQTAAKMLSENLNKKAKEKNFVEAKDYDAKVYNNLDKIIDDVATPVNTILTTGMNYTAIKPTKNVDESRNQLKTLTEADNKNTEQLNKDKIVLKVTSTGSGAAPVYNTVSFDVSQMSNAEIQAWKGKDDELFGKLSAAKQKYEQGLQRAGAFHNAMYPIQTQFGTNLLNQAKSIRIPDPNKDGNDYVREIGEEIYKQTNPENYAVYQKAGGYDKTNTYREQKFDNSLDQVNKEIMTLGYNSLRGDAAANGTDAQYANIFDNLRYLDYKFSTPKEQETKHRIASALKEKGINPSNATEAQKDEVARLLPQDSQEVWFNKTKESGHTDLPNTGFMYSAGKSAVRTGTNVLESGSILSPTSWATLFLGVPSDKENAKEVLRDQMQSDVIGENPESRQRYDGLINKQKSQMLSSPEQKELNDLSSFTNKRTEWDKFKDGNGNMVGMVAAVTVDALPTLLAGGISKGLVKGTEALVGEQQAAKSITEIPLLENTTANATKTFSEKLGIPQDTKSIINFAKNKNEMFVIMHHDNAKRAIELFPEDDTKKAWYTGITDVISLALPNLLPTHKLGELFNQETKDIISEVVGKLNEKELDKAVIGDMMKETAKKIIDRSGSFLVGTEKTAAEAALTMSLMTLGNNVTQAILKPDSITGGQIADNFTETFSSTFLDSQLLGLIGGVNSVQKKYGQVGVDAIYDATSHNNSVNAVKYNILEQLSKGQLTQEEANSKISLLHTAAELRPAVNDLQKSENLSTNESKRVFINLLNERIQKNKLKQMKDAGASEALMKPVETRIKEINDINNKIIGKEIIVNDDYSITDKKADYEQKVASAKAEIEKGKIPEGQVSQSSEGKGKEVLTIEDLKPTIVINGKEYSGKNHGEAMDKAIAAGENIPDKGTPEGKKFRSENGMFKDKEGNLLTREQSGEKFGIRNSEELADNKPQKDKIDFNGLRDDDFALKYFDKDEYKKWSDLEIENPESAKEMIAKKKEFLQGEPEQDATKKEWDSLSMSEKLKLAKENLPEVSKLSDLDAVKIADSNAKMLLEKLHVNKEQQKDDLGKEIAATGMYGIDKNAEPQKSIDYAIDKAVENPSTFQKDYPELFEKIKSLIPTEKIEHSLDYYIDKMGDSPNVKILDDMLAERQQQEISSQTKTNNDGKNDEKADGKKESGKEDGESRKEGSDKKDAVKDGSEPGSGDSGEPPAIKKEFEKAGDKFSAITKARISEVEAAKAMFEKESPTTWTNEHTKAMEGLQAKYPDSTLYEAARQQAAEQAFNYDNGIDYNPTSKDIAVLQYLQAETESRMSKLNIDTNDTTQMAYAAAQADMYEADLLRIAKAAQTREAGTAFGLRNREIKLGFNNSDAGLISRRIKLINAKAGEKLTPEENEWTAQQWEKEKEILHRENELKLQGQKELFDKEIAKITKDYEQKIKDASKNKKDTETKREKTLKQSGKEAADKIKNLQIKTSGLQSNLLGLPIAIYNGLILGISKLVEGGATVADAIKEMLKDDAYKALTEDMLTKHIVDSVDRQENRAASLEKIKKFAEDNKVNDVTNDMVAKKLVNDYVDSYVGEELPENIIKKATEDLKIVLPDITEDRLREAYIKRGEFRQPTKKELESQDKKDKATLVKISKIEQDISDLKNKQQVFTDKGNMSAAKEVNNRIKEREKELLDEMNNQGKKFSSSDKYTKASYDSRAKSHNQRIDELSKKIQDKIDDKDSKLSDAQKSALAALKDGLSKAIIKLNPESKLDQKPVLEDGLNELKKVKSRFDQFATKLDNISKLGEFKKELQKLIDSFNHDIDTSEQDIKLARTKDQLKSQNAETQRKINAGEFDEPKKTELTKSDKELVSLQIDKNNIESEFIRRQKKLQEQNKGKLGKWAETFRNFYVTSLIWKFGTLAKVFVAGLTRPTMENLSKLVGGGIFDKVFHDIYTAAKRGGESSSMKSIRESYNAQFIQHGEKRMQKTFDDANEKYENSSKAFDDASRELLEIKKDKGEELKEFKKGQESLQKLKNEMDSDLLNAMSNYLYRFIGSSSVIDGLGALMYRSNRIEQMFGYMDKEELKTPVLANKLDNFNYLLGFIGRSHSMMKTFSARANFAAGFVSRLEAAMADGVDIKENILQIAKDSYLDWDRGKYQKSNFITDAVNNVSWFLENKYKGTSYEKYGYGLSQMLKWDIPITRVPVNILHEAVAEYTLGFFTSIMKAGKEYYKANKEIKEATDYLSDSKEFKDAIKERIKNMDAKTAATIARSFRKGFFGLAVFGIVATTGLVHFGGFYQKGVKKKKESDLEEGEMNVGEIMFGKTKAAELFSKIIEHTPALYPALIGSHTYSVYKDKIQSGEMTVDAAIDAVVSDIETIENGVPQTELIKPTKWIGKLKDSFLNTLAPKTSEDDTDELGNKIDRKALNFIDELNLMNFSIGSINLMKANRGAVLSESNYRTAKSIQSSYKEAIKQMYKDNESQTKIDEKIKERDDAIKEIYKVNKEEYDLLKEAKDTK